MLFAIQVQNTGHIFLLLVCIVALGYKQKTLVPKNRAAPIFHFIFYFKIFIQENGAKIFWSTRSDYACF